MAVPKQALDLIRVSEGCKLVCYADGVGFKTIGVGHKVINDSYQIGDAISQETADSLLLSDAEEAMNEVQSLVTVDLNDNQLSALIDFVFNLGSGNFSKSTLLKKLNADDYSGAANEFQKWVYAGHEIEEGLVRRRDAEKALFLS